ncbi:Putative lipoprotein Hmuk_2215, partial [Durusdinium trenchii]
MLLTNLREGTAFFASACLIAIGGGMALLSNTERVSMIAEDLILDTAPESVLEVKILVVILLLTAAFLKFVWANRVFGYCAVLAGTIPNDLSDPRCAIRSRQAGELNVTAARAFNKGLRSVYFALGALAWLVGAWALIVATALTLIMIIRREYVTAREAGGGWRFDVTILHPDTGWDHYADGWEVLAPDGTRLGFRELFHPHVEEQPFTRSLSGITIPDTLTEVIVRPRCNLTGWAEE